MYHNFSNVISNEIVPIGTELVDNVAYNINRQFLVIDRWTIDMGPIKEYIYNKYPKKFKRTLINDLEHLQNTDIIITGKVQIAKTSVIITSAWISLHCKNEIPVIVAWDKLGVLYQTKSRIDEFDTDLVNRFNTNVYCLNPKIIETSSLPTLSGTDPYCLMTILRPKRLEKLMEIIEQGVRDGKRYRIIFDESDQTIKSKDSINELVSMNNLMKSPHINNLNFTYVSATNYVLYNSDKRFVNRQYKVIQIPENIYKRKGLKYRSFQSFIKFETEILSNIAKSQILNNSQWEAIIHLLSDFSQIRHSGQPNIGLFNLFYKNDTKVNFGIDLSQRIPNIFVVVYKGNNSYVYRSGQKIMEFRSKIFIGQILDWFQAEYRNQILHYPILIVSTGLAGRAVTFKTSDNSWILTHHYLNKEEIAIDSLLQCLRGAGQFRPSDIRLKFYASKRIIDSLDESNYNNEIITYNILQSPSTPMRDVIEQTYFLSYTDSKPIKFVLRPDIDDAKPMDIKTKHNAVANNRDDIITQAEVLRVSHNCSEVIEVAHLDSIPIQLYYNIVNRNLNRDELAHKFYTDKPYEGLDRSMQAELKTEIKLYLAQKGYSIQKCQICYSNQRQRQLNELHHMKSSGFKAQVIAFDCNRTDSIPIVIYNMNYVNNPSSYVNKVLIWPGTDGKYYCYVNNNMDKKLKLYNLKHKL
jgi:hypothetical protein